MSPGRRGVVGVLATIALLAPAAGHAGTLDVAQENTGGGATPIDSSNALAQTFTSTKTGDLDQVDLFVGGGISQPLAVQIQSVTMAGAPSGTVLASASVDAASVPDLGGWVSFMFISPAAVQANTAYAIVTPFVPDVYAWWRSSGDVYAGGTAFSQRPMTPWIAAPTDFAFRTYVATSTAVRFRSLSTTRSARGVHVRWATASEHDVLGFHVYREQNGRRTRASERLIPAKSGFGRKYSYLDRRAPAAARVRYWIQAVNFDGSRRWYGPARAVRP